MTRSDSGAKLTSGATLSLELAIEGKVIARAGQLRNGVASVRLTVPASASGKVLATRTTVTFAGHSVTKQSSVRVA